MKNNNLPLNDSSSNAIDKDNTFSFYKKPIKNVTPSKELSLHDAWMLIIGDEYKSSTNELRSINDIPHKKDFKASNFDYVTFNGTFTKRNEKDLLKASNYFTIDIDTLGDNLMKVRQRIIDDKVLSPQLVFISPSGDGLKIIIKIDSNLIDFDSNSNKTNTIWQSVNSYFSVHYSDLISPKDSFGYIDKACKDISRACFLCHDSTAHLNVNDDAIIDDTFFSQYQPLEIKTKSTTSKTKSNSKIKVNPATTLDDLASRHLLPNENHHDDLLRFIGASSTIGTTKEVTLDYILNYVNISQDSTRYDINKLKELIDDVYQRYNTDYDDVKVLSQVEIGYNILKFKYSKDTKTYIPTSLYWDEVRSVLHKAGFAKRKVGKNYVYIQKKGCIISEVSTENMRDYMTDYVDGIVNILNFSYQGEKYTIYPITIREIYLKNSNNIFNAKWLEHLLINDEPILKDTNDEMYFYFNNVIVTISKEGLNIEEWKEKKGFCVWDKQVIKHDFCHTTEYTSSHFYKFLRNVTNHNDERYLTLVTGIGYLVHYNFKESEGQAVILYDETITDTKTPQGGSGKGLIVNAISQIRNVTKIDGKSFDTTNRFKWELITPSTQVVFLDDVKPTFDFSVLHSNLTDGWTIERKYLSQFTIAPHDSPKTIITSNSIIKGEGSTNKRRQHEIELSTHYSKKIINGDEKPIEDEHGCIFFSTSWNVDEWNMFFSLMFDCAFQYLNHGFKRSKGVNIELNRFRQSTSEEFAEWIETCNLIPNERYESKTYYDRFIQLFYGNTHTIGQRTFTGWIKYYAKYKRLTYESKQSNSTTYFILKSI